MKHNLYSHISKDQKKNLWKVVGTNTVDSASYMGERFHTKLPQYLYKKGGTLQYLKALASRPAFILGFIIILIIIFATIIAPEVTSFTDQGLQKPTGLKGQEIFWRDQRNLGFGELGDGTTVHLFGTDNRGADLWSLIWYGTRNTLAIAFSVSATSLLVGVTLGLLIGYFSAVDWFFQRVVKILTNIPSLVILLLMSTILGRTLESLIVAFILFSWVGMAFQVRAQVFRVRNLVYNKASKIMGSSSAYILFRNVLPAALPIVITQLMFLIPSTILAESALGFIGFSLDPLEQTTLGTIIQSNVEVFAVKPAVLFTPIIVLLLITLSIQLMGDSINKVNREGAR